MYKFELSKRSKKYDCPNCGRKKFTPYVGIGTDEILNLKCGRCDRQESCAYHFKPNEYFDQNPDKKTMSTNLFFDLPEEIKPIDFIPTEVLKKSFVNWKENHFIAFLGKVFKPETINLLQSMYFIGRAKGYNAQTKQLMSSNAKATVFYQIDLNGNIRQAKVMLYDPKTGKRDKPTGAYFAGKRILKKKDPNLKQCFYGEHLLKGNNCKVGLVESEKTAILMTGFAIEGCAPIMTYIASGGSNGCRWYSADVSHVLNGRDVVLFPDIGVYANWEEKSKFLHGCKSVFVYDDLEQYPNYNGLDIADFFFGTFSNNDSKVERQRDQVINFFKEKNKHFASLSNFLKLELIS